MAKKLEKLKSFAGVDGPVVCIVMDGVGLSDGEGNAIAASNTPTLNRLFASCPWTKLKAHGTAVGLPSDEDMGNSEVGHNALGAGQVFAQGAKLVTSSIEKGEVFRSGTWKELADGCKNGGTLHFIGLFSDGNVHSHIDHLKAMIRQAKADGVGRVRVHILLDGRDVGERSALEYVLPFEDFLSGLRDGCFDVKIASGGGRMNITMDRYGANWSMVERGWHTHVLGDGRQFPCAAEAINTFRSEADVVDQDLPPFVVAEKGEPVGKIVDGDSVIFFNFRGDRALEISEAFDNPAFEKFDRVAYPKVLYAGMLEYDGDMHVPARYLINPPQIENTMGEYLAGEGVTQFVVSETQKYGHVTYFWNGNKSGKFSEATETYEEIRSDVVPFEQRPWMKSADIADRLCEVIEGGKYRFIRVNFPNGDMVGHTGSFDATIIGVESVDLALARILKSVDRAGGVALITADHGNADAMYELDKSGKAKRNADGTPVPRTAHSLNPVPCILYSGGKYSFKMKDGAFGLSSVAATLVNLMGYKAPEMWDESILYIV